MRKKLDSSGGFTLVEMLCAVAILTLLCLMLGTGMQAAMETYREITAESETQLLLNTLVDANADELRYAHGAETDGSGALTYNDGRSLTIRDGRVLAGDEELLPTGKAGSGPGGAYHGGAYQAEEIAGREFLSFDPAASCFTLHLKVTWKDGDISAETPEDGVVIRCLNLPKGMGGTS